MEASSLEEAMEKVRNGEGEYGEKEFVDDSSEPDEDLDWQASLNEDLPEFLPGENNEEIKKEEQEKVRDGRLLRRKIGKERRKDKGS